MAVNSIAFQLLHSNFPLCESYLRFVDSERTSEAVPAQDFSSAGWSKVESGTEISVSSRERGTRVPSFALAMWRVDFGGNLGPMVAALTTESLGICDLRSLEKTSTALSE